MMLTVMATQEAVGPMAAPSEQVPRQSRSSPARVVFDRDGATAAGDPLVGRWWPRTRSLADELPAFVDAWTPGFTRIQRVLYSRPDWDDRPRSVKVTGRWLKTGSFPRDDTHRLTVSLANRTECLVTVIAPHTEDAAARRLLDGSTGSRGDESANRGWDNEGGAVLQPEGS